MSSRYTVDELLTLLYSFSEEEDHKERQGLELLTFQVWHEDTIDPQDMSQMFHPVPTDAAAYVGKCDDLFARLDPERLTVEGMTMPLMMIHPKTCPPEAFAALTNRAAYLGKCVARIRRDFPERESELMALID